MKLRSMAHAYMVCSVLASNPPQIADFGMARDLEDENYYISQGAGKIPVKWTAPEVCIYHELLNRYDHCSYLCFNLYRPEISRNSPLPVMYEIWSLGHKPFEGYTTQQVHSSTYVTK